MKRISVLILLFVSIFAFSQDANMWMFTFEFTIKPQKNNLYQYKDFELFINDSYNPRNLQGFESKYDSINKKYNVSLMYTCISCGYKGGEQPPELYLKFNLEDAPPFDKKKFSVLIPVYFHSSLEWPIIENHKKKVINIGEIDVDRFLTPNPDTYEVIEMFSPDSKKYSRKGEYTARKIDRLISILTESENRK